jgi:negative regulator of flagellin synthesis FlgM
MAISPVNAQPSVSLARAVAAHRRAAQAAPPTSARQGDSITLSETARTLSAATASASAASDDRADKIAAIKAAIAKGTYSVDSRQVAQAMVRILAA